MSTSFWQNYPATFSICQSFSLQILPRSFASTFDLYLDGGDATGELASDASGYAGAEANGLTKIGTLFWESNGGDDEVMRSQVFEV